MRILPPLPAAAQLVPASTTAATGGSRMLAAEVVASLGDDLYQVLAGRLTLDVRSTMPLQPGQSVQLQLPKQELPAAMAGAAPAPSGNPASATSPTPPAATPIPARLQTPVALPQPVPVQTVPVRSGPPGALGHPPLIPPVVVPAAPLSSTSLKLLLSLPALSGSAPAEAVRARQSADGYPAAPTSATRDTPAPTRPAAAPPPSDPLRAEARQQMQLLMPRQQDPGRLVSLLRSLQPVLAQAGQTQATPLQQAVTQLLASLPDTASLRLPDAIRRMLQGSGLVSESLARDDGQAPADLKQALQAVRDASPGPLPAPPPRQGVAAGHLQPLPAPALTAAASSDRIDPMPLLLQVAAEVEPVLARLETHQLMHLQQPDPLVQQWLFELPLRHGQDISLWQMHVEKDGRQARADEAAGDNLWSMTLSVDFPETGPLMIRLGLHDSQLHAHFHAEASATVDRVRAQLPALREALEEKGITAPLLTCQRGLPHPDSLPAMPRSTLQVSA